TVVAVAAEKNSTLVLPFPVELLRFLERAQQGAAPRQDAAPRRQGAAREDVEPERSAPPQPVPSPRPEASGPSPEPPEGSRTRQD
ncbi:slipin family protein, partial [Streptomyces sp. NPDC048566]